MMQKHCSQYYQTKILWKAQNMAAAQQKNDATYQLKYVFAILAIYE